VQCAQQTGHGHALRLRVLQLAGRTASASSGCIGSITCPFIAIDHHRNKPSLEPILHRATKRICFYEMLPAATKDPARAALVRVPSVADSDPKPRSALRI